LCDIPAGADSGGRVIERLNYPPEKKITWAIKKFSPLLGFFLTLAIWALPLSKYISKSAPVNRTNFLSRSNNKLYFFNVLKYHSIA
jgi:hypothetical protein